MKKQSICLKNDVGFENTSSWFFYLIIQGKLKQSPFKTGTVSCGIFVAKINLV